MLKEPRFGQQLFDDLVERGLDTRRPMLIDGSKALRKAMKKTFGNESRCSAARCISSRMWGEYLSPDCARAADQRIRAGCGTMRRPSRGC